MGLASAMSTALTGLTASETTIDVVGNNLANANTVGFKASEANFATQFLQTQSLGSAPTATSGGTNPRQSGLGAMVAEITPNFSQGTIQVSSNPTDLAVQGDGFFIVQGNSGEQLYTRNGILKTNGENQLVNITGNRLLGYGTNNEFQIDTTRLVPLQIPLGTAMVAKATQNVYLEGTLTPSGTIADTAQIIQTGILTDGSKSFPSSGPTVSLNGAGVLSGKYKYYVTFVNGNVESRPNEVASDSPLLNGNQVRLNGIATDNSGQWLTRRVYRSVNDVAGDTNYYLVDELPDTTDAAATIDDNLTDAQIRATGEAMSFYGPPVTSLTLLNDVVAYDGTTFQQTFPGTGTLNFTGIKGGRTLATRDFDVTTTSTLRDLATFMEQALGIQRSPGADPTYPIPKDAASGLPPGGDITNDGRLRFVGNNGTDNAVSIGLSGLQVTTADVPPQQLNVSLPFNVAQQAKGQTCVADMVVYDSLGMPLSVRVTAVLEQRTGTYTQYRWFADCGDNDPPPGSSNIAVGTGVIRFDGDGNYTFANNNQVSIDRYNVPSVKPLQYSMDFTSLSGLAAENASLAVSRQDGSAPGVLTSFLIGEDGRIRGVFSNGVSRDLGQIRLARFANANGLEQKGQNMYSTNVNSGLPIQGNPGEQGIGTVVSGAVELSNSDIGGNLIELILASTMYRGNTRVITTAQQMFDELLALRR